ncbi:Olfactory receptor 4P4 [Lemmus lemmus]
MYYFLFYLSLSDTCFTTTIAPRTIVDSLLKEASISFNECIKQVFTFHFFGSLEIFILILMAVDRYVAIFISYIIILSTLRMRSSKGRRKALSTCGSHITVVFMFFLPLIFTYVPMGDSIGDDKVFALFYTVIAPLFNPLIYTLRNTDMKNAMRKVWCQEKLSEGK